MVRTVVKHRRMATSCLTPWPTRPHTCDCRSSLRCYDFLTRACRALLLLQLQLVHPRHKSKRIRKRLTHSATRAILYPAWRVCPICLCPPLSHL